ncbi:MAG: hypothetical protein ACJAZ2_000454 [Glaciecola sp.]|jgi:hypothetical protein
MKKINLTFLFIVAISFSSIAQSMEEYLKVVAADYNAVAVETWRYAKKAKHSGEVEPLESTRRQLITKTQTAIKRLKDLGGWEGDAKFSGAVMRHYETNLKVLQHGYPLLIDLGKYKNKSSFEMEKYIRKEKKLRDDLLTTNMVAAQAQTDFTVSHKINTDADNMGLVKRMEKAGLAYDYYDKIFMMNFESTKLDAELVEALKTKEVKKIEIVRLKLLKSSNAGLAKVNAIGPYGTDNRMIMPTKQLLNFYKKEAEELVPTQIEFFNAQIHLKEHAKVMGAKKKRTKQDVEKFNVEMRELKAKTELYNRENDKMNVRRTYVVNVWNNDAKNFIDINVPE